MKKIHNFIATRILKYRGITNIYYKQTNPKIIERIRCSTCGREWKPNRTNEQKLLFGHINCPDVLVRPVLKFERYQ